MNVMRDWYVVFDRFEKIRPWFRPWVHKGFEHAYLVGVTDDGDYITIERARPGIQAVFHPEHDGCQLVDELCKTATAVVRVEGVRLTRSWPPPVVGVRCVRFIKRAIGLRGFSVTPYQTFCALRAAGHKVIVGPN